MNIIKKLFIEAKMKVLEKRNKNKGVSLDKMFLNGNRHQRRKAIKIAKKLGKRK